MEAKDKAVLFNPALSEDKANAIKAWMKATYPPEETKAPAKTTPDSVFASPYGPPDGDAY